ncbi:uncharacterized protein CTRU02_210805 [Colletotrichum truncatum]|uniref:Integral membrane protein n=1 Tax=Colletotrichum truncatum TaxID=5467 RepID=A0ACC3YQ03_COLTU|nr:uncharacterized protein CTRU02_03710 [Colletotrichum truncatum]KAF6796732.1 integral membrane protein [Colletotrichum truncatum]
MATNATATQPLDPEWAAESNTERIMAVVTIFHVLAMTSVCLRLYARIWMIKAPGWDDWVMCLCAICAVCGWIVFVIQAHYGLGKHFLTIDKDDYVKFQHAGWFQSVLSAALSMMFLKISIGLNLLRLGGNKWYTWALWATIVITFIQSGSGVFTFTFYCQPTAGFWDKSLKPRCWPLDLFIRLGVMNTALNIVTDVVLATLPIPLVWNLQMKRKVRLYVIGILSLGYFAVGLGIVKAFYQLAMGADKDKTFEQGIQFWGFLQLQTGIVAACAPALKPLVSRMLKLSSYDDYTHETYGDQSRRTRIGEGTNQTQGPRDQYELDNLGDSDSALSNTKGETTTTAEFYKNATRDGAGSEERILDSGQSHGLKGIVKTTEVTVR